MSKPGVRSCLSAPAPAPFHQSEQEVALLESQIAALASHIHRQNERHRVLAEQFAHCKKDYQLLRRAHATLRNAYDGLKGRTAHGAAPQTTIEKHRRSTHSNDQAGRQRMLLSSSCEPKREQDSQTTAPKEKCSQKDMPSDKAIGASKVGQAFLNRRHTLPARARSREESSDVEIVSERAVKKRRPLPSNGDQKGRHSDIQLLRVKSEIIEDCPSEKRHNLGFKGIGCGPVSDAFGDSLDLDEVSGTIATPRKSFHRDLNDKSSVIRHHVDQTSLDQDFLSEEPESAHISVANEHMSRGSRSSRREDMQSRFNVALPVKRRQTIGDEGEFQSCASVLKSYSNGAENVTTGQSRPANVLRCLDVNALPRSSAQIGSSSARKPFNVSDRGHRGAHGVHVIPHIAEDGEVIVSGRKRALQTSISDIDKENRGDTHSRLQNLLQGPTRSFHQPRQKFVKDLVPKKTSHSFTCQSPVQGQDTACTPQTLETQDHASDTINPTQEPLRARPCHRLNLDDFRLNPRHSHFAYHETIRRHDEKKARGGCTDMACQRCRELADFMQANGFGVSDESILVNYLGADTATTITVEERSRLLPIAKRAYITDKFGRHRQGQRVAPEEPPGFWDFDFPTTQENEQLRLKAARLDRQKVEQRWSEAMRDGGKWIFADEV